MPGSTSTYTNIVTEWETVARWDGLAPLDLRLRGREGWAGGGDRAESAHGTGADGGASSSSGQSKRFTQRRCSQ